jgi:hypothetical protein
MNSPRKSKQVEKIGIVNINFNIDENILES